MRCRSPAKGRQAAPEEGIEDRAAGEQQQKPVAQEIPADRRIFQAKINAPFLELRLQAVHIRDKEALSRKALVFALVYDSRLAGGRQAILQYGNFLYLAAPQNRLKLTVAEPALQEIAAEPPRKPEQG